MYGMTVPLRGTPSCTSAASTSARSKSREQPAVMVNRPGERGGLAAVHDSQVSTVVLHDTSQLGVEVREGTLERFALRRRAYQAE